ncbi:hypothetical protein C1H76_9345 [Elsinoe australis]|uniref:Uncharacterized protein n=1 Tax=Elsinoe australis TaxID=40998 RepID=A0A4U7AQC4_9PEZI|nr:hypothetical protein C1H76_9345 [Elsinoe australis]
MASELKRSPSFSLRKSFESTRFRRKHADSTATAPDSEPPPPVPVLPRAATTHFEEPKHTEPKQEEPKNEGPRLSKRKSVRDFFNQAIGPRVSRRGKRRTRVSNHLVVINDFFTHPKQADSNGSNRSSRVVNFSAVAEQENLAPRGTSIDTSRDVSSVRSSAYSGNDTYKPLSAHPPTPRMATVKEEPQVRPLREADLRKMFFGAPQFSLAGSRDYPRPEATYRDQDPDSTHDGRDFLDLQHSSFELATLQSTDGDNFLDRIRGAGGTIEMPSMLGIHGLEPGTVSMDHFLQLPLSLPQETTRDSRAYPKRLVLQTDPESIGLRALQIERYIDRLSELGDLQELHDDDDSDMTATVNEQKASEMYSDLFSKLLTPPKYTTSSDDDPTGLDVQISALVRTLNLPDMWYDFSNPDERIRLGQIIWSAQGEPDGVEVVDNRNVLLLQITLAAELLTRLELNQRRSDDDSNDGSPRRRSPGITRKIVWDLVLAKRFLQDVCIAPGKIDGDKEGRNLNRSSLFSMLSFVTARESFEDDQELQPILYPRHERTQLNGLLSFAMALEWPHLDELKQKINTRVQESEDGAKQAYTAPLGTPAFNPDDRDSYFGVLVRPNAGRTLTSQSVQLLPPVSPDQYSHMNAGGWLSRSWLTGLVLPGESASHLLISSLLENSSNALTTLGDTANLTGGFIYHSRSYWSKSCIVGRVLAALDNTNDCMGWISAPSPSPSHPDGWINITSLPTAHSSPRIKFPALLTSLSAPYPDPKTTPLTDPDFHYPTDGPPILGNEIRAHVLTFEASPTTFELSTPVPLATSPRSSSASSPHLTSALPTSQAVLTFTPPRSATNLTNLAIPLRHGVHFVASQPCFPKPRTTPGGTPRKDTTGAPEKKDKELPAPPCHPLLKSYAYETVPALALLGDDERVRKFVEQSREEEGGEAGARDRQDSGAGRSPRVQQQGGKGGKSEERDVLVLDARGSGELQLLARAWCAMVGEDAVVGRVERSCFGCCVREARGLGVGVVIRV